MDITPAHIKAVYSMLRQMPPFSRWKLPHADTVCFLLLRDPKTAAQYYIDRRHEISVNGDIHTTLLQLTESVAHEMVHMQQELRGLLPVKGDPHNAHFRRWRKQVCHSLGFDVQKF